MRCPSPNVPGMRISVEQLDARHRIQAYGSEGIRVADTLHVGTLLVSADCLVIDWDGPGPGDLIETNLSAVFEMEPEVIVVGTGASRIALPELLSVSLQSRGLGLEIMATGSACRTYNVLLSEGRRVVALLYPETMS
jgi:uncharacterized protein